MAIYHLSMKAISRAHGRSATASAAYRAAARIVDERSGQVFDYRGRTGVAHTELVFPSEAPEWLRDRTALWNAAEEAEQRANSTVAREIEVALPTELTSTQRLELVREFAQELAARHRCAVDVAVHTPSRMSDERNHHAHLLMTTRRLDGEGLTKKTRELDDYKSGEVGYWRERWAGLVNQHLATHGHEARVDHRSLADQGIEREPTRHKGPAIAAMERRGMPVEVSRREVWQAAEDNDRRLSLAAEEGVLARERVQLERQIVLVSTDIAAARRARDEAVSSQTHERRATLTSATVVPTTTTPPRLELPPGVDLDDDYSLG